MRWELSMMLLVIIEVQLMMKIQTLGLVGLRADVVDLEDHLDELCGEHNLLLLRVECLDHVMLFHVRVASHHAIDTERSGILLNVARLQL